MSIVKFATIGLQLGLVECALSSFAIFGMPGVPGACVTSRRWVEMRELLFDAMPT